MKRSAIRYQVVPGKGSLFNVLDTHSVKNAAMSVSKDRADKIAKELNK